MLTMKHLADVRMTGVGQMTEAPTLPLLRIAAAVAGNARDAPFRSRDLGFSAMLENKFSWLKMSRSIEYKAVPSGL